MTEEIIIDGVDVAGCNDFYKEWDNWSGKDNYRCQDFLSGMCAGNNCYYKQLKRLEQREKALTEIADNLQKRNHDLTLMNERLEQDIKQLTQWLDEARNNADFWCNKCTNLEQENKELKEKVKELDKMTGIFSARLCNNYRSALEKIREIAKFNQFYNPEDLLINGDIGRIQDLKMTEIYNKINEVLNGRL